MTANNAFATHIPDAILIDVSIDRLYERMLNDHRINRFFSSKPAREQSKPLKQLLQALLTGVSIDQLQALIDDYFACAFARSHHKTSLITANDLAFLLGVIGGRQIKTSKPLCASHRFLLKLQPDDFHYDVMLEHLDAALQEINATTATEVFKQQILTLAENARDAVLGRQAHSRLH